MRKTIAVLCFALILGVVESVSAQWVDAQTPSNAAPVGVYGRWSLAFSDEFNTNDLDTSKWGIDVSSSSRAARASQGIAKWYWKAANVSLDGSNLVLAVTKESSDTMHCGSVSSDGIYEPTYGFLESRIEIADTTKSTHTAFWLQGWSMLTSADDDTAWDGAEVDIFESAWFGDTTKAVVHIDGYGAGKQANTKSYSTPGLHDGYHVFGLEWTHDYMNIYYDGELKVTYSGTWVPRTNEWIWLSDGASFGDVGTFTSESIGHLTEAKFDYVRVWDRLPSTDTPAFTSDPVNKADATEDVAYSGSLTNTATDGDNDLLTYSKQSGPGWLSVASDGTLSGTPAQSDVGTNSWSVQVSDGTNGNDTATLKITVVATNDAPIFGSDPIDEPYAVKDVPYTNTIFGTATDEEDDPLTYSKQSGPSWLSVATNGALSGTPSASDIGTNTWSVQVSDGNGGTDAATLRIWVKDDVNVAPVADAGSDRTVFLGVAPPCPTPSAASMAAWYDASDASTITDSAGTVSAWNDKSGSGNHLTAVNDPQTGTRDINGSNVIDFAGDRFTMTSDIEMLGKAAFLVVETDALSANQMLLANSAVNVQLRIATSGSIEYRAQAPYYNTSPSSTELLSIGRPAVIGYFLNSNMEYSVNGIFEVSGGNDGSGSTIYNQVGARGSGANYFNGKMGELIVMSSLPDTGMRQDIEGYLALKWGLAGNLPTNHPYTVAAVANLAGVVTDDNGDTPTTVWTQESGPGLVSFGNTGAVDTVAAFPRVGTYVLRLTADDGLEQVYDEVTVTVGYDDDADGMLDSWEIGHFGDTNVVDGTGDQDADGFVDLHEFLAGTDPTNDTSLLAVTDGQQGSATNEFVLTWQAVSNKSYMILTRDALTNATWVTNESYRGIPGVEPICVHTVLTSGAHSYYLLRLEH